MRDERETNESTERGGVHIKKDRAQNGALWRSASERFTRREIRRDETAGMWNDRYEVNHCRGSSEMPNQVERRRSKMEWSRVSKAAKRQRWQTKDTC